MPELTKPEICRLLPHDGAMCLLDHVDRWDDAGIRCRTDSHRNVGNPLRRENRLESVCGLEYAAQAMGVHVGLLNPDRSAGGLIGYVGGVRDVSVRRERLDDVAGPLSIEAIRLFEGGDSFLYQFTLTAEGGEIMTGRASIFLRPVGS